MHSYSYPDPVLHVLVTFGKGGRRAQVPACLVAACMLAAHAPEPCLVCDLISLGRNAHY